VSDALDRAGFVCSRVWSEDETEFHPDVPALLRSLKRIGAGNASTDHAKSLAERRVMLTMMHLYGEKYGRDGSIPATYEVIYGWGLKKGSCSPPTGGEIMARGMSHATPSIERTD
jgi:malonyl-CoA O-methyltransferase